MKKTSTSLMTNNKDVCFIIIVGDNWNKGHRRHKLKTGHVNNEFV